MRKQCSFVLALVLFASTVYAQSVTLTIAKPVYTPNELLVVSFIGAPGNAKDYIAIKPQGAPEGVWVSSVIWAFTSGDQNGGIAGIQQGSVSLGLGLPDGSYEARFYANDSLTSTTRVPFSILSGGGPITATANSILSWDQEAKSLIEAQSYTYRIYPDGDFTGTIMLASCIGPGSPFICSTPLPAFTVGIHTVTVTAANAVGVSLPSAPLSFAMVGLVPVRPANLRIR